MGFHQVSNQDVVMVVCVTMGPRGFPQAVLRSGRRRPFVLLLLLLLMVTTQLIVYASNPQCRSSFLRKWAGDQQMDHADSCGGESGAFLYSVLTTYCKYSVSTYLAWAGWVGRATFWVRARGETGTDFIWRKFSRRMFTMWGRQATG